MTQDTKNNKSFMDKITGARKGPYFFWVGPPGKLQATSPQALKH